MKLFLGEKTTKNNNSTLLILFPLKTFSNYLLRIGFVSCSQGTFGWFLNSLLFHFCHYNIFFYLFHRNSPQSHRQTLCFRICHRYFNFP